jgi:hypothetical protein
MLVALYLDLGDCNPTFTLLFQNPDTQKLLLRAPVEHSILPTTNLVLGSTYTLETFVHYFFLFLSYTSPSYL